MEIPPGEVLQEFVSSLTRNVFLREFSVSSGKLKIPAGEIEVADVLVLLRGITLVFQAKERDPSADSSSKALENWFRKRVHGEAVKQIADTHAYLSEHAGRTVQNDRGYDVILAKTAASETTSLVVYGIAEAAEFRGGSGHTSSRAGFVHFIEASDYLQLCQVLRTPAELSEYFRFREIAHDHVSRGSHVSEKALVGQFLADAPGPPQERYAAAFDSLLSSGTDDDLSILLENLGERVTYRKGDTTETSHYCILEELALLPRAGLVAFKERLRLCVEIAEVGGFREPFHFSVPGTDCGFVFTAWDADLPIPEEEYLETLTRLSKYDLATRRQVGLSVSHDGDEFFFLWGYIDEAHAPNPDLDAALAAPGNPLPRTREQVFPRYQFDSDGLERLLGREQKQSDGTSEPPPDQL